MRRRTRVCSRDRKSFVVREESAGQASDRRGRGLDGFLQLQKRFAQGSERHLRVGHRRTFATVRDRLQQKAKR